ncbi:hypothetical protein, partial [Pseudomonas syringae group genomosp. 7]|uniref:hypothetical protein n=1 Tax=Pseudomonas syringae group genomosp. 7 TaxID=251699 RepID=UPI001B80470A
RFGGFFIGFRKSHEQLSIGFLPTAQPPVATDALTPEVFSSASFYCPSIAHLNPCSAIICGS